MHNLSLQLLQWHQIVILSVALSQDHPTSRKKSFDASLCSMMACPASWTVPRRGGKRRWSPSVAGRRRCACITYHGQLTRRRVLVPSGSSTLHVTLRSTSYSVLWNCLPLYSTPLAPAACLHGWCIAYAPTCLVCPIHKKPSLRLRRGRAVHLTAHDDSSIPVEQEIFLIRRNQQTKQARLVVLPTLPTLLPAFFACPAAESESESCWVPIDCGHSVWEPSLNHA